ncbi:GAF domain-containing sensor histidine kinase [Longimicrobium sp.]|uniref:GAF domain-containing sensor histidine kinase n=1 Tax=Longimicrobium sp. TaxID=2029185 RepID=UPI003B3A9179
MTTSTAPEGAVDPAFTAAAAPHPDVVAISRISAVPTILKVISENTGLRLALVARVTENEWTALATLDRMEFGLRAGDHLDVATTLCSEVRSSREPIVIEHASQEPEFCGHPTPRLYGFESYIAVPIFRGGEYFGNVCALDSRPAPLRDGKTLEMMKLFAELIGVQLTAEEQHERDRQALVAERRNAELREQFIAVLGHDLRNPLSSVITGSAFLMDICEQPKQRNVLERVHSSGHRMARLIDDVLDFARGRLGGGISLEPERVDDVAVLATQVVAEVAGAHPGRTLRLMAADAGPAVLDRTRAAQLMSNLVGNAVQHSPPQAAVEVRVEDAGDHVRFSVSNMGEPIPAELLPRLFEPYVRASGDRPRHGLGLGLYIAAEIARSHGGTLHATSSAESGTTFTALLPRSGPS